MYDVSLKEDEDPEDLFEAPTALGQCPYSDCPEPNIPIWEFVCSGPPDGWEPERDNRTCQYRLHREGLAPPALVAWVTTSETWPAFIAS